MTAQMLPAACIRAGDTILLNGEPTLVTNTERIGTGALYLIQTERGDITRGASQRIALLPKELAA